MNPQRETDPPCGDLYGFLARYTHLNQTEKLNKSCAAPEPHDQKPNDENCFRHDRSHDRH